MSGSERLAPRQATGPGERLDVGQLVERWDVYCRGGASAGLRGCCAGDRLNGADRPGRRARARPVGDRHCTVQDLPVDRIRQTSTPNYPDEYAPDRADPTDTFSCALGTQSFNTVATCVTRFGNYNYVLPTLENVEFACYVVRQKKKVL